MPRLIDHDARKAAIAEALWRVIVRDGEAAVSIRTVAAEAGLAVGSLRHSFPSKADLLAYAMELVHARVSERVAAHVGGHEPLPLVRSMLLEFLPLDETRAVEMRVNLALIGESPAQPRLRAQALDAQRAIRSACHSGVTHLRDTGHVHPARDLDAEAARLHALVDGLALHMTVDAAADGDLAVRLVDGHLAELATAPVAP